ncbi:EYxxD motif small membrane protein [Alkalihalobacterium alkalinitrilicum]
MLTEFAIDSLFIYASVIGSIIVIVYFFMKKKRAR